MNTFRRGLLACAFALSACSSGSHETPPPSAGGSGGGGAAGGGVVGAGGFGAGGAGAAGSPGGGLGAGGTGAGGTGGATGGTGGSGTSGGTGGSGGSGGGGKDDGSAPGGSGGSSGTADGSAGDGAAPIVAGDVLGFYEAEAVPPNQIIAGAVVGGCGAGTPVCGPPDTVQPETMCCFGGKEVRQLLRGRGGLQFNNVMAPADGMYDVTWWYHCGNNDNFHDPVCRGEPHTPAGCRPGKLTVNGADITPTFEFPCFPGSWGVVHAATTPVPLKAGAMNSIKIVAGFPQNDAVDVDAIAVYPAGKGIKPRLPLSKNPN